MDSDDLSGKDTDAFLRVEIMWPYPPEAALPKYLLPPKKKATGLPVTPEVLRPPRAPHMAAPRIPESISVCDDQIFDFA
jgi:hypothetical protein